VRRRFTPQAWALRCRITQQPSQRPVGDALGQRSARSTVLLAWAGIIGPIPFTAAFLAQEAFLVDDYSPLAETVSALEAQPHGWVQQINFVVFGLLTIAFAVGLDGGVRPTRASAVGPALFVVAPRRPPVSRPTRNPLATVPHRVGREHGCAPRDMIGRGEATEAWSPPRATPPLLRRPASPTPTSTARQPAAAWPRSNRQTHSFRSWRAGWRRGHALGNKDRDVPSRSPVTRLADLYRELAECAPTKVGERLGHFLERVRALHRDRELSGDDSDGKLVQ
jgi:hypothetical protein